MAQGGGGNGGGGGGPDIIEEDRFSMGMSPGAMGGKLPGFGNWAKRTFGPLAHAYSQIPTPTNLLMRGWKGVQRWRQNKKVEEEARLQQEIEDHNIKAAQDAQAARQAQQVQQVQQNIQTYGNRDRPDAGMNAPGGGKGQSPTGGNVEGTPFAQGGRIGYRNGEFVDEDINIQGPGFDVNENIEMASEGGEGDILEQLVAKYIAAGFPPDQAQEMAMQELQQMVAESGQGEGIASLV